MKIIVGLGNPGSQYVGTRHNVGFEVIDALARTFATSAFRHWCDSLVADCRLEGQTVVLVKPQTFMNLSGRAVRALLDFYKLSPQQLLVVCDDIHLPIGKLRLRARGSHGGHNGLRDIQQHLGSEEYPRLRIGVGTPRPGEAVSYVLGRFAASERPLIEQAIERAAEAVACWIGQGLETAMNRFNAPEAVTPRRAVPPASPAVPPSPPPGNSSSSS
jgi:PTH1 family peptidyl-tRNA hydrolase